MNSTADEAKSTHSFWRIPCLIKTMENKVIKMCVHLSTTLVERKFSVDKTKLDFGSQAVGDSKVLSIILSNTSENDLQIQPTTLNSCGGFSLIHPINGIPGNTSKTVDIQFYPSKQQIYKEVLEFKSLNGSVQIELNGEGIRPSLVITPENLSELDMGVVFTGQTSSRSIKIQNTSLFAIDYKVRLSNIDYRNNNSIPIFTVLPSEGKLESNEVTEVIFYFTSDRILNFPYKCNVLIDIPNQTRPHTFDLIGRCVNTPLYIYNKESESIKPSGLENTTCNISLPRIIYIIFSTIFTVFNRTSK